MSERLTFTLEGRDRLSGVLGHAGASAERLRRQMEDASDGSGRAMLTLTQDAQGRLHDLEGRFVSAADAAALFGHRTTEAERPVADWGRVATEAGRAGRELATSLLTLTPAVIPMAATLAPIAASTTAAAGGLAVFALAAGRQVAAMTQAAEAETKYTDAVEENGAASQAALTAQIAYARQMAKLPPATRQAAAALSVFKDTYADWSDAVAQDTTAPLIKGMGVLGAIFPKLTPMVKGSGDQLDRVLTLAGGGVASPGFDAFMGKMDRWSTGALTSATDKLVHLLRVANDGDVGSGIGDFMDWAREQGPATAAVLQDLGRALVHVLESGADVGVGMLDVVSALSHLVGSVPSEAITLMLQLAISIKATSLAMAGLGTARAVVAAFTAQVATMGATSSTASGRLAALTAGFGAMSRGAKAALIGSGIGLLVIALSELSAGSAKAPPDVDKLTSSLKELGSTGRVTGEAAAAFGNDLAGLYDKVRSLTDPSTADAVQQFIVTLGGLGTWDSTPVKQAKENIEAVDQALTNLVRNGQTDLAAAAAQRLGEEYAKSGRGAEEFTGQLDGYQSALADLRFEQQLAGQAMGLFGQQAVATKAKLDAQKLSADGLRQSLQALNDVNRAGLGGMVAFEAALDATTDAAKKNAGAWGTNANTYDLTSEKGRTAATALSDLAAKTDAATAAARESGASWSTVNGIYDRGRTALIAAAQQMGLSEAAARRLADQILRTPDKTARLKGNMEDLQAKLTAARAQLGKVPDSRKAQVRASITQLEAQLAAARQKLDALNGKTATTYVKTVFSSDRVVSPSGSGPGGFPKYASGTDSAASGWALVGEEGPELVRMRGGEQVFDHRTSLRMAAAMADYPTISLGQDAGAGLAAGLLRSVSSVDVAARRMAAGVETGVRAELEIASPSKKMTALMKDVRDGIVVGLTGSKAKIKATAMDLVADIWKAWEGKKTNVDNALVKMVNREHAKLQKLASTRDAVKARLGNAQALLKSRIEERDRYAADIRTQARSASGLSSLGLEPKQVTTKAIKQGLAQKLSKLRQFTRWIGVLAKRGINKNLLREVLAMGPEDGYAYASALAGMSNADLRAVNSLQSQIDKESDTLGKRAASTLYDAGVNSAKGLVAGLQSQEKAIEQQMVKIAKAMEKAIKTALGIRSPSRVAWGITTNFVRSLGGGALAGIPYLDGVMGKVAGRMAGINPMPGRPAAGLAANGTGAGGGMTVNVTVQGAIDPMSTARQIQKVLLELKRTGGGVTLGVA
ncbi:MULTISPECIES: hypothetical protein [unclassified Streptomyces]|uniref:hypothetical protein n=1 Tax=unclassified Streptomyces TaxID=2593676 RepID=UPI001660F3A3|nr:MULTISPECIES: hypothetical protein [unclassified Streptomyces]MBD0707397.1 hypothetical protein [Streptomyces sp. CBMA291]MBD0715151.1 hypothetical protein [Streptomyces sp. CBMA370]